MGQLTFESAIRHAVFYNYPKEKSKEDYIKLINEVTESLTQFPETKAVYQFGTNASPGISDIDLLVVMDNCAIPGRIARIGISPLQKDTNSLFIHPPLLFNEANFANLNMLYPHLKTCLSCIGGKSIRMKPLSKQELKLVETVLFADLCIILYSKDFIQEILARRIDIRYILCRLSSLKYTIKLLQKITGEKKTEWKSFVNECSDLKKKWFENPQENLSLLKECLPTAIKFNFQIIFDFATYLQKVFNLRTMDTWSYINPYFYTIFLSKYNPKNFDYYQNLLFKIFQKTGFTAGIIPNVLGIQPQLYSHLKCAFGNHIRTYLSIKQNVLDINTILAGSIKKRGNCLQDYLSFLQNNNLSFGYPLNFYGLRLTSNRFKSLYDQYIHLKSKYIHHRIIPLTAHA